MIVLLTILFVFAIIFTKWWIAVVLGLLIAPYRYGGVIIIMGGALIDALYGAPIPALGGFAHIYLLLFVLVAIGAYVIHDRVSA